MKKILSLLVFSLFATFSKAQVGIRYVSGVPTAATYTPNISKKESTVVYSTTAFKLYRWDGSGWLEVINSSAGTTYTAGTGISLSNNFITNTGDLSNTNELPIFTTSTTAPIAPKTGDVWNDTSAPSATNIKPTILEKKWNGGTWYTTNAASNSSISYNAGTGVFGISVMDNLRRIR